MDLMKLLGLSKQGQKNQDLGELFEGIREILESRPEEEIKLVTGIAGLLGKVAYADMEISGEEIKRIREILETQIKLDNGQIDAIVKILDSQHAKLFSIEDYVYLRLLNEACDKEKKLAILDTLFKVAAADNSVSGEEDAVLWSVAKGLKLSHRDFVDARQKFKNYLDVLK